MTVDSACKKYLNDAENGRKLQPSTLRRHRYLCNQLTSFAEARGWETVKSWNLERIAEFRNSWNELILAAVKKLERLRQLFQFWLERGWIEKNYAKQLGNPQVRRVPTLPSTKEEMARILAACERWGTHCQGERGKVNPPRIRALVLLMRYSGLRIQDAVTIGRERIIDGKTSCTPRRLELPFGVHFHHSCLRRWAGYPWFTTAITSGGVNPQKEGATKNWQKGLKSVFLSAGIPGGHPQLVPRYVCRRIALARHPNRARVDTSGSREREDY